MTHEMFKSILVPLDGSKLADSILTKVRRLLCGTDNGLVLLSVVPPRVGGENEDVESKRVEEAKSHLSELRSLLTVDGRPVKTDVVIGDAAESILTYAEDNPPSLIAMSTHGHTGIKRWTRGSVAERVLRRTRTPLLLANPFALVEKVGEGETEFNRILVPVDGSAQSARILSLVQEMAQLYDSEVILFHVWGMGPPSLSNPEEATKEYQNKALEMLQGLGKPLEEKGITVTCKVGMGAPAVQILDAAEQENVDLVAMTTHGRSGLSKWIYGSVADRVIDRCSSPLLVLRTGESE